MATVGRPALAGRTWVMTHGSEVECDENGPQRALLVLGDGRVEDRREMLALIEALGGGRLGIVGSDGEYDYYEVQGL